MRAQCSSWLPFFFLSLFEDVCEEAGNRMKSFHVISSFLREDKNLNVRYPHAFRSSELA